MCITQPGPITSVLALAMSRYLLDLFEIGHSIEGLPRPNIIYSGIDTKLAAGSLKKAKQTSFMVTQVKDEQVFIEFYVHFKIELPESA